MTHNEPQWATDAELKKLPRLIAWKCHNCGEYGFTDKYPKDNKCRKCWHTYRTSDQIADSWGGANDKMRFTQQVVPEWRANMPWVFAWTPDKCPKCGETIWRPIDKLDILGWRQHHVCNTKPQDLNFLVQEALSIQDDVWNHLDALQAKLEEIRKLSAQLSEVRSR